jgi:hypothetical protein
MADCECIGGCIFFNDKMAKKPATADLMKQRYCRGDNAKCARFVVRQVLGKEGVPSDLFPGDLLKAQNIISLQPRR